jgi:hypothetical protein
MIGMLGSGFVGGGYVAMAVASMAADFLGANISLIIELMRNAHSQNQQDHNSIFEYMRGY